MYSILVSKNDVNLLSNIDSVVTNATNISCVHIIHESDVIYNIDVLALKYGSYSNCIAELIRENFKHFNPRLGKLTLPDSVIISQLSDEPSLILLLSTEPSNTVIKECIRRNSRLKMFVDDNLKLKTFNDFID